jgi:hypothetical protein
MARRPNIAGVEFFHQLQNDSWVVKVKIGCKKLIVDELYQRMLKMTKVNERLKKFNPFLVQPVKLSYRDGMLWIVDGQHTRKLLELKGYEEFDAVLFTDLTKQQEASLFYLADVSRVRLQGQSKLQSGYIGGDPSTVGAVTVLRDNGFTVSVADTVEELPLVHHNEYDFYANLQSIVGIYARQPDAFARTIRGYRSWRVGKNLRPAAKEVEMLRGATRFVNAHCWGLTDSQIEQVFKSVSPEQIAKKAQDLRAKAGKCRATGNYVAMALLSRTEGLIEELREGKRKAA